MFAILRQRNVRLLWSAGLISTLGDWVLAASLPFYVYLLTGSVLATGTMFFIEVIPRLVFGSLAGVLVDQWNLKWTMILSDAARALLLVSLLFVHTTNSLWIIYTVGFIETTISLLFGPAKGALLPEIVPEHNLLQVNTLGSVGDNCSRLLGPILGGALLGFAGIYSVVVLDILSYLISGALLLMIQSPTSSANRTHPHATSTVQSWWQQWMRGLKFLYQLPWLRMLCVVMSTGMCAQGFVNVLLVVFVRQSLHSNALAFGWIMSAQGIGGILGGFLIGHACKLVSSARILACSLTLVGLLFFLIVNIPIYTVALVLFTLVGVPVVGWTVGATTLLQQRIDRQYRGRILGAYSSILTISMLIGMGLASLWGGISGASLCLNVAALLLIASGLIAFIAIKDFSTTIRSTDQASVTISTE
jgi:MFS family permease